MALKSRVKILFVEGETESSLFKKMKQANLICVKQIVKKNLWAEDIRSYALNIPKNSDVLVVFDSDEVTQIDRFVRNVNFLNKRGHVVHLLQQTTNFEEELSWCCNQSMRCLISCFCPGKTSGINDFKRDFISCTKPLDKLITLGLKPERWFSRELHGSLVALQHLKSSFMKHFSLRS